MHSTIAVSASSPVAVVTGGAGGIGEATVRALHAAGWRVAILDRALSQAQSLAAEIGGLAVQVDISDVRSLEAAGLKVERELGPCHGLVAAAAHLENPHPPQDQDPLEWERIVATNLTGTFHTLRVFSAPMLRARRGAIVTVSSITALNSSPLVAYGPSKAGIVAMTRNCAVAWGRSGVRVNCVCPGPTRTPAAEASYQRGERDPTMMERQTALGRLVQPSEVASAIAWLLSDASSAVTGTVMPVDAGVLAAQLWNLYGGVPEAQL
jgi:NAD(P)-dependent dehydrogenase (short-subunit alcohol dehydrogenase family)